MQTTVPPIIVDLVERFERNREAYRSGRYNETQVRREFIDPFFEALGWDVNNRQGFAESYKDVVHEDSIDVDGAKKAPDYCFRVGGARKFFVEAKKPSVNIREDLHPAFQLRRYAWSAKLPLSVVTDFEEFAVFDCRARPDKSDKSVTGRNMMLTYRDYLTRWDEIAGVFSKEAVLKGAFDQFAESATVKKGTAEVDDVFLGEIERWREMLAHNLALRNPEFFQPRPGRSAKTCQANLNFAVQSTIDRIIFLRIAEDRGIEDYGRLRMAAEGKNVYPALGELFRQADQRYNSGLFHFNPKDGDGSADTFTLNLKIDDKPLKDMLRELYFPDSPFEFSVIPADILGQVYERFLGKVIRLTTGGQAKVEEKPEVRKAGGVFYTPTYIVDYIVKQTVGKLLEGRKVDSKEPLRVLDMSCGSGSFLIGAYQYLLDWHLEQYRQEPEKWMRKRSPALFVDKDGDYCLTIEERKRILLDHIYGVDIDSQAVEVTKLSLLLKVLEGESGRSVGQMSLFQERALPDLENNIKCGNSLIGPDFYDGQQWSLMDEDTTARVNVFDWKASFPQVFKDGGFDAIIGNPPYVRQEGLGDVKNYFEKQFSVYRSTADLYVYFIEKGIKVLNHKGLFGMIVSNKWLRAAYGEPLRDFLTKKTTLKQIIDFAGLPVFEDATVRTVVIICAPLPDLETKFLYLAPLTKEEFSQVKKKQDFSDFIINRAKSYLLTNLSKESWSLSDDTEANLLTSLIRSSLSLKAYVGKKPFRGIITGKNEAFVIDSSIREQLISANPECAEVIKPLIVGRDIRKYAIEYKDRFLIWCYVGIPIERYPAIYSHLKKFEDALQKRWDKGNHWWELRACDYYPLFNQPKIIYPDISTSCRFTLDRKGYFSTNTTYFIPGDDLYLLGILNSKLAQFYFSKMCAGLEGGGTIYLRFFGQYMEEFPVHEIDASNMMELKNRDLICQLAEKIMELQSRLAEAQTPNEKTLLQRQIDAADRQIDRLVYDLYGLTEDEIRVVEGEK